MAWLTNSEFRDKYITESASEVKNSQIDDCLEDAVGHIEKRISTEAFNDVSLNVPLSPKRAGDIRRAQGKLAYAELLLIQSARYRNGGILTQEKDINNSATDTYESFQMTEKRREVLKKEAEELLIRYYPETILPTAKENFSGSARIEVEW